MLSTINIHERDKNISFQDIGHIYTIHGKQDYKSVTSIIKGYFNAFNADLIIDKMMNSSKWPESKYYGKTKYEIKKEWKENGEIAAKLGTQMHKLIENYYNGINEIVDSIEYNYFQRFIKDFPQLKPYRTEWTIYDEELKISGSVDMLFMNEDGTLSIYDWKRTKGLEKSTQYKKYAKYPIQHIPDTNFWQYSLQLNLYKLIIERNYNFVVKDMYLVCIHPELESYQRDEVETMDLTILIENYKKSR